MRLFVAIFVSLAAASQCRAVELIPQSRPDPEAECRARAKAALALSASAPAKKAPKCDPKDCKCETPTDQCGCPADACPCCAKTKKVSPPAYFYGSDGKLYSINPNGSYSPCQTGRCPTPR